MNISICIIAKHESQTIERCFDSCLTFADEFVVGIDKKSTDGTYEIVKEYAEKHPKIPFNIYRFDWINSFAKTRNEGMDKAKGDWIISIDGHEYFHRKCRHGVRKLLEDTPPYIELYSVKFYNEPQFGLGYPSGGEVPEIDLQQPHIFRNEPRIRFSRDSHNIISEDAVPQDARGRAPEIVMVHHRPEDLKMPRRKQREEMNIPFFEKVLKKNPKDQSAIFYMCMSWSDVAAGDRDENGMIIWDHKALRKSVRWGEKYIKLFDNRTEGQGYEVAAKMGEIYTELGEYEKAKKAYSHCIRYNPERAEAYHAMGQIIKLQMMDLFDKYAVDGKIPPENNPSYAVEFFMLLQKAEHVLKVAEETPIPVTNAYIRPADYEFRATLALAELYHEVFLYGHQEQHFYEAHTRYEKLIKNMPYMVAYQNSLKQLQREYHEIKKVEIELKKAELKLPEGDRKSIIVVDKQGSFTYDLVTQLAKMKCDLLPRPFPEYKHLLVGDIIFSAWTDDAAIKLSNNDYRENKLFVRLCGYEAYTDMPNRVNWDNVSGLVVISETMKKYVIDTFNPSCPITVIKHGVDISKYKYKERSHGPNIAFSGFIRECKGIMEAADIISALPDSVLHIAGLVQDNGLWRSFWDRLRRNGAADRVKFYGWQSDIDKWLDSIDANYYLCSSWRESFGFSIAEAMAKGIVPVIRCSEATQEHWRAESIYYDVQGAIVMLRSDCGYDSKAQRAYVRKRYNVKREAKEYLKLFYGGDK